MNAQDNTTAPRAKATAKAKSAVLIGWSEQDNLLRDMWQRGEPPTAIGSALGRTIPSIMTRAARLGLPRRFSPGRKSQRNRQDTNTPSSTTTARARPQEPSSALIAVSKQGTVIVSRVCLMCLTKFPSAGPHNRICGSCKGTSVYESASRLPDLDFPV